VDFGVTIGEHVILEHINLHMHCGELTALIGPNGAGKTTLLRSILGEVPHHGELRFMPFGQRGNRAPHIGYVPQRLELDAQAPVTVQDLFAAAASHWPVWLGVRRQVRAQSLAALAVVGAEPLLEQRLGQLSGGQLQRVLLALALAPVPEILLLDEPVAGVDQAGVALFYQMISKLRRDYDLSILLISHDLLACARVADRVVFLNRTILGDGPPAEVLSSPQVRQTMGFDLAGHELAAASDPYRRHTAGGSGEAR
jgi:zinc transport system ATP-binding protein